MSRMSNYRFPTGIQQDLLLPYTATASGGPVTGDVVIGAVSGAAGACGGYLTAPDRVFVAIIVNGPGGPDGTPFLPGEKLDVPSSSKQLTLGTSFKQSGSPSAFGGQDFVDDAQI